MARPLGNVLRLAAAASLLTGSPVAAADKADLLLVNGQVSTPSGWKEAVAVRRGVIVYVGNDDGAEKLRSASTRVVDLRGAAVFPGLHDMHAHSSFAGIEQFQCRFAYGAPPAQIADAVKKCARGKPAEEWIVGGNWVSAVFKPGEQNLAFLDRAAPNNPVMLADEAHHSIWVNSKALELAGVTDKTQNPVGGIIERDARGNLTGVLREEAATRLIERIVPEPSPEMKRKALLFASNQMLSYGITSYTEATVRQRDIALLSEASRGGLLKQRGPRLHRLATGGVIRAEVDRRSGILFERAVQDGLRQDIRRRRSDREPHGRNAPAVSGRGSRSSFKRLPVARPTDLEPGRGRIRSAGIAGQVPCRWRRRSARGDRCRGLCPPPERMGGLAHDVGHNSFVDKSDIIRAGENQMTWEFSPYIWFPTPIPVTDIQGAVGPERMSRFIPVAEAVRTGANVVVGSDWSVVPSVNPWLAMETLVTRRAPGGGTASIAPEERITLDLALDIFTRNAARLMRHADKVGTIAPGMLADLVVTETNPFRVPISDVHKTKARMTFIEGEKVYDSSSPPRLEPE